MENSIVIKMGSDLTSDELLGINTAVFREFNVKPKKRDEFNDTSFFFLKNNEKILAMGGLKKVDPVLLGDEKFQLLGFVEVVANVKGKGYGKKVVSYMSEYLQEKGVTGIGYTMPQNATFYEKCGFKIEKNLTHRFVFLKGGKKITDTLGQVIFYQEGKDDFMTKVLNKNQLMVILPTNGLW